MIGASVTLGPAFGQRRRIPQSRASDLPADRLVGVRAQAGNDLGHEGVVAGAGMEERQPGLGVLKIAWVVEQLGSGGAPVHASHGAPNRPACHVAPARQFRCSSTPRCAQHHDGIVADSQMNARPLDRETPLPRVEEAARGGALGRSIGCSSASTPIRRADCSQSNGTEVPAVLVPARRRSDGSL